MANPTQYLRTQASAHQPDSAGQQLQQSIAPDVHLLADTGNPSRPFIIAAFHQEGRLIRYFQWRTSLAGLKKTQD